ncbi:MAG: 1-acyl-sn-glycerol-3-phosphate acyltransferase [Acholeplasma sp.]|nr:1-acyl-sn-glycerol-3-phosphate acyltransferase [Acholeplasma sp.]
MISLIFIIVWFSVAGLLSGFSGLSLWFLPLWFVVGYMIAWISMILILILMLPYGKMTKVDNKFKHYFIRSIARFVSLFVLRLNIKILGKEKLPKKGGYVIYANHKSYADPFILYQIINRPTGMAAKKGIYKLSVIRNWMPLFGCIQIDRENNREAAKSILKGIEQIKKGMIMGIFPEGGIKDRQDEKMVAIKAGAYKLATKADAPIVPVTMIGASDVKHRAPFKTTQIKVIIHDPIFKEDYEALSTVELGEKVAELVNQTIKNGK